MIEKIIKYCFYGADSVKSSTGYATEVYKIDGLDLVFNTAKAAKHKADQDLARKQGQD
jgi:hypothetical protein